jgi:hypothetical protein
MGGIGALANSIARILIQPPQHDAITTKSLAYSIDAAVSGILDAAEFVVATRRQ